jgi:hypothetical protein
MFVKRETPSCRFNNGVECDDHVRGRDFICEDCGWNAEEQERRIERIREELAEDE